MASPALKLYQRMTAVQKCLDELTVESKMAMQRQLVEQGTFVLSVAGEELELRPEMVSFKTEEQNVYDGTCFGYLFMLFLSSLLLIEHFTPHVIEPSFGISRLVYAILEQNFYLRDGDEPRAVLSFPPVIAPVAVTIFPLLNNKGFVVFIEKLSKEFRQVINFNKLRSRGFIYLYLLFIG
jgi:glycyl-tRNA synthetase